MNKKVVSYILIGLMFLMPIISIEDIIPWIVALFFINKSIKEFKINNQIKSTFLNFVYCGGLIFIFNIGAKYIEGILIKAWL